MVFATLVRRSGDAQYNYMYASFGRDGSVAYPHHLFDD